MNDDCGTLFVAVPVIADNPRYGWQIVSKKEFKSEKITNKVIDDIEESLGSKDNGKYVECYLSDGMIGCSHLKNAKCDHVCHLIGNIHEKRK